VEVRERAEQLKLLSYTDVEADPQARIGNIDVINDVFPGATLHCWCNWPQDNPVRPNDVLVYTSNKYYWVAWLRPDSVRITKTDIDGDYIPIREKTAVFEFEVGTEEYQRLSEIADFLHKAEEVDD